MNYVTIGVLTNRLDGLYFSKNNIELNYGHNWMEYSTNLILSKKSKGSPFFAEKDIKCADIYYSYVCNILSNIINVSSVMEFYFLKIKPNFWWTLVHCSHKIQCFLWVSKLIFNQTSLFFLGPTIFEIPQLNWH